MTALLDRIRTFIRDHDLLRPDRGVVAAVSGGSDSVALACLLHELQKRGELMLAGVAHFNHQLRATADRDEAHTAAVARLLSVAMVSDRAEIAAQAKAERQSLEAAARRARYEFFERARRHFDADVVALGHTRDDQAETFLLRLLRGAGPRGLAAMHPRRGTIVRPLLACRRSELREFLAAIHVSFVHDESNDDISIPRNRVRAELIPILEERFNPAIVDVLADEADLARETWQWLHDETVEWRATHVRAEGCARRINLAALAALPVVRRRAAMWHVLTEAGRSPLVGFAHVSSALRVADPHGPPAFDLPGARLERIGGEVVLTNRDAAARAKPANLFRYPVSIPGEVRLPGSDGVLSVEAISSTALLPDGVQPCARTGSGPVALVRMDRVRGGILAVRNRVPGDRFRPAGLEGHKKLQDFFVDRKIARYDRDCVPIVVDCDDRIIWVAGHRIDETFRVTDGAQHVLLLRLRKP
jgi:tRNA(Ile)-lysidine synthase